MADVRRVIEIDVKTSAQAVATMRQLAQQADAMEKRFAAVQSTAQGFISTLIGGLTIGGIIHSIRSTAEAFDEMGKRAERLGVTTEALSALTYQAKLADISAEELDVAMVKLNKNLASMDDAASTGAKALQRLGISGDDPMQALEEIAEQFSKMEDGAKKTALAVELFGRAGAKMIPMLNQGAAGMKQAREDAEALGLVIGRDAVNAAQRFNDAMKTLEQSGVGARNKLFTPIVEALADVTEAFYGAGTAALSFGEKVLLAFSTRINLGEYVELENKLESLRKERDALLAAPREEGFIARLKGTDTDENLRAIERAIEGYTKEKAAIDDLMKKQAALGRLRAQGRASGDAGDLDAAKRAEALRKELEKLAGQINSMTSEGKIAALTKQLEAIPKLVKEGYISDTVAAEAKTKLERAILKEGDAYDKLQAELLDEEEAHQALMDRMMALNEMFIAGDIGIDKYIELWLKANDALEGHKDELTDLEKAYMELGEAIKREVAGWSGKAAQAVVDFVNHTETNLHQMVSKILQEFERMALQILVFDPIFKSFANTLRGLFPGGGYAAGAGDYGQTTALGAAFGPGGRLAFARGGVVNRPTLFAFAGGTGLMGEAGPEAIMPLKRSATGALGVEAQGGGVTVNVINNTDSQVSVEQGRGPQDEKTITVMVEQAVQDAFSRGRFDSLMSSTYGMNRRGR